MAILTVWQGPARCEVEFQPPQPLDQILNQNGYLADHPCGGHGTCGKCKVQMRGAASGDCKVEECLRCQTVLTGSAEVWLPEDSSPVSAQSFCPDAAAHSAALGAAVDIGTTTMAVNLYDLHTGNCLASCMAHNPQQSVAADVMGRIQASLTGSGQMLQQQVLAGLEQLLAGACSSAGCRTEAIQHMVIAGNTTMLYLLLGKAPYSLATAPFQADDLFGRYETVLNRRVWLPPCMSAFVGADITAAVLASGMCRNDETSLLCDIGTNGELALWKNGTLYVTSTAAGPALEGAQITCGCHGIAGAIDKVWQENGNIKFHTIDEHPAIGICGSGLIDAIAAFLDTDALDETGAMEAACLPICDGVSLYPKDIRNVQLAKAAIAAGIETLLEQAGTNASEIRHLYLAGNFGSHLNIHNAARIGLIPEILQNRVVLLGNAALAGAAMLLQDQQLQAAVEQIVAHAVCVNLGGNPVFNEKFIEHMLFEN